MNLTVAALGLCAAVAVAAPAFADWRDDLGAFRIGVVMQNSKNYDPLRFDGFRRIVSETLPLPVEIFQACDAAARIDAVATSRVEAAGAGEYRSAHALVSALGTKEDR
jgi:phosphonate transport system substrate-binding protein